ncbi:hypothetical protein [Plantactinospora sp. KBS50]|uniref:hypothetical protein n=1 Tax=Plantactinospora sp. KBS50 TaxID=2024580 RepID=UPI0018E03250|nr:hypothetical protein [Plantactinospora sp. KBS50]
MAVGDGGPATPGGVPPGRPDRRPGARTAQQWLLTLLPAFPVLLLVLRLWQLSRQDMSTMLLLVQYVSPLGLLSALLIALVWAFPFGVLVLGVLGWLLRISAPDRFDPERSLLASVAARTPGWVFAGAIVLAALTWQLRFLPTLLMLALWLAGLRARYRWPDRPDRLLAVGVALPVLAALVAYGWLGPAIVSALRGGELVTGLLLALPPAGAVVLTGPVPRRLAPAVTHGAAYAVAAVAPFLMGAVFLRAAVLPSAAVEVGPEPPATGPVEVVVGQVVTVTDRMTVVLDERGNVRFVPNEEVRAQVLCLETTRIPRSAVRAHAWPVEETALNWVMPRRTVIEPDPRCAGRVAPPAPAGSPAAGFPAPGPSAPGPTASGSPASGSPAPASPAVESRPTGRPDATAVPG